MGALENLNNNFDKLAADVRAELAKPKGVPEADVQAVADKVAALDAEVNPPVA